MGRDFCWEQLERVEERGITHTQAPPLTLACSAVVGLWGWHSWQCPSTLGTISLLLCQSQPTLITFKFTKLYWQDERGHCCLPSCWENKYKADLSQESGFPVDPVQVHFGVMSEKCTKKNVSMFSVSCSPFFFFWSWWECIRYEPPYITCCLSQACRYATVTQRHNALSFQAVERKIAQGQISLQKAPSL